MLVKGLEKVRVVRVSCGNQHTLALADDGHVYSWGLGVFGQLGHGDHRTRLLPQMIETMMDVPVKSVACGTHHSVVLTGDGLFA